MGSLFFFTFAHCTLNIHIAQTCSYQSAFQKKKKEKKVQSQFSFDWKKLIWAFCAIHKATFLPLSCWILKQAVQNPSQLISLDVGVTTCCPLLRLEFHQQENVWQKQQIKLRSLCLSKIQKNPPQPEIKGNDLVRSFSSDKKDFLVPSLKLNSWSKLTSYRALCNLRLLLPTRVIVLLTGLFVEEILSA